MDKTDRGDKKPQSGSAENEVKRRFLALTLTYHSDKVRRCVCEHEERAMQIRHQYSRPRNLAGFFQGGLSAWN